MQKNDEVRNLNKYIVFGQGHYNTLGIVRSLGENGIKPIVILTDSDVKLVASSKFVGKCIIASSIKDGYKELLRYGDKINKSFVFTSDDRATSYLDNHYCELADCFYFFNAGTNGRITKYMEKDVMYELAKKCGLKVLDNITTPNNIVPLVNDFPVLTKGVDSIKVTGWKKDVHICNNESELKDAFQHIEAPVVMVQKYIHKKNELCMEGFSCRKGNDVFISIASTYNYILADSYSPYMTVRNFTNRELIDPLKKMFAEIGFEGIFEIEFLEDQDGQLYFGEINFRNSTWSYASTCAGMPLPILWAKSMLVGKQIEGCYNIVPENFTAMVELDDLRRRVKTKKISLLDWLKDYKKANCLYYKGKNDIKPLLHACVSIIRRKAER